MMTCCPDGTAPAAGWKDKVAACGRRVNAADAAALLGYPNGEEIASLVVSDGPLGVDIDPITDLAFVACLQANDVVVINGSAKTVKATVSGILGASYVAVNIATQKLYVTGLRGVTVLTR